MFNKRDQHVLVIIGVCGLIAMAVIYPPLAYMYGIEFAIVMLFPPVMLYLATVTCCVIVTPSSQLIPLNNVGTELQSVVSL